VRLEHLKEEMSLLPDNNKKIIVTTNQCLLK
jgi:hypothetical protein